MKHTYQFPTRELLGGREVTPSSIGLRLEFTQSQYDKKIDEAARRIIITHRVPAIAEIEPKCQARSIEKRQSKNYQLTQSGNSFAPYYGLTTTITNCRRMSEV
jgi:TRAP-type uncharacterized transport system substrate-binding protein